MSGFFSWMLDNGWNVDTGAAETFHFWWPWIGFCVGALVLYFYYLLEGRKRFVKGRTLPIHKYILDRVSNQVALLAFVGLFIIAGRALFVNTFFAYRFWRYGWLAWGAALAVYWLVYFIRHYHDDAARWIAHQTNARYIPQPRARRKATSRAG
jgi:hypothetical protein